MAGIVALGLFVMAARNMTDPDVWWHLRTGQLILQNHAVFHVDPYSFAAAGQPWINHEWLTDLLMFRLYQVGGAGALVIAFAAIAAATSLLLFARSPGKPYIAAATTLWGGMISGPTWGVRPQVVSLLLASLFLWILEASEKKSKLLWALIPLMVLWVNLHAGFAIGIALIALFLLGELFSVVLGFEVWKNSFPRLRRLLLLLIACVAVIPLNPYGTRIYSYPWQTLSSRFMATYIQEWASPDFHRSIYLPFLGMILALLFVVAVSSRRLRPREILLLVVLSYAGLRSVRHIPIFALVAAPILAEQLQAILDEHGIRLADRDGSASPAKALLNGLVLATLCGFVFLWVRDVVQREPEAEAAYPAQAVKFLAHSNLPGPLFNDYNWGGYLIWKLYPGTKVFVDGRADLYGDAFLQNLASIYFVGNEWQSKFDAWGIRSVLLPPSAPLAEALRLRPGWKQVYADSQAVILTRK